MKYNYLDVIKYFLCYVRLFFVRTSSLVNIQALDLLLVHSQNVNWITTAQINPRHEKMQISFYKIMFLETIWFFFIIIRIFIFFYLYIFIAPAGISPLRDFAKRRNPEEAPY